MEDTKTLAWEEIKGITKGKILTTDNSPVNPDNYGNIAKLGSSLYIKAEDVPEGISDTLQDREEINGQQYCNLNKALELDGKGETDEEFLYQEKGIEEIISEKTRTIPAIIEQQIFYGLELTLLEVEKRYFDNAPAEFAGGKILLQQTLDQKFNQYILRRKQQQFEAENRRLSKETTEGQLNEIQKREKLEAYLKDKLFDLKILSFQELKNIEQFSFEKLDEKRRKQFLDKVKNNYNRLQQYSDEFLDLINIIIISDVTQLMQQQALDHIEKQESNRYYQAEKQLMRQGLLARLFREPLTEEQFTSRYKKTPEQMQQDITRRKTPFQRRLGKEILDKFISTDFEEEKEEKQVVVDAGKTKYSVRKSYLFGDEKDELGVIRHNLAAKDIVNIAEIFDQAQKLLRPRIETINSSIVFEDKYLNSLKASWIYANIAILEWKDKIKQKKKELNAEQTTDSSMTLNKIVKKIQSGTATKQDYDMLNRLQRKLTNVAGRDKMIEEDLVGIFDQKTRDKLMKEIQEGEE